MIGPDNKTTEILGDQKFKAPEVLLGKPYNEKADIFSLGVIIYFMCTQTYPYGDIFFKNSNQNKRTSIKLANIEQEIIQKGANLKLLSRMGYSMNCIDLISKLLNKDSTQRIAPEKALSHVWITSYMDLHKKKFRPTTMTSIRPSQIHASSSMMIRASKASKAVKNELTLKIPDRKNRRRSPS